MSITYSKKQLLFKESVIVEMSTVRLSVLILSPGETSILAFVAMIKPRSINIWY